MDTTTCKIHLLSLVVCLLIQWASGRAVPEKLSADQKAPAFANSSAGRSLALPRSDRSGDSPSDESVPISALGQILARLHLKASGQTPADTSLLPRRAPKTSSLLNIKASGQTPADTSLLPKQEAGSQSRRVGQGPAHVTLLTAGQGTGDASGLTPANVGLLPGKGGGGGSLPRPPAAASSAQQEDGVQREEMTSFKDVNGESIRVVVGNYGYQSPEGLPISFKYMSDENGNQASFSIGTAAAGGGSGSRPAGGGASGSKAAGAGGAAGSKAAGGAAGGGKGAAGAKGAAGGSTGDGDRKYLPPK